MSSSKRQRFIEVKSGSMYAPTATKIAKKGTVASVIVRGTISANAKQILKRAKITFAERFEMERKEKERRG